MNGTNASWEVVPECDKDADLPEEERLLRFVVHGVMLNGIAGAGLLGNALAVLVLSRPQMRSSINCLLVGLALADTALILTSVLLFGLPAVYPYTGHLRYYYYHVYPHLTPYVFPLANAAQTMSVYLTLVVTLERWVAVCHPFRAKALCTESRARLYVLGTALFALAYNAPKFLEAEAYRVADVYCVRARAFRTPAYVMLYIHWLYLAVMYIVPFSLLAVLNACIVRQVRRAQAERARLSRGQRRELSLATMLLVVVLVFFLCNLLPLVTNAFEVFEGERLEHLDALVRVSNLFVMVNSSVNFLIYVIFGEKFKRVFLKLFCAGRGWARAGTARDSPDHTRDDSCASCATGPPTAHERLSLRLARAPTRRPSARARQTSLPRRAPSAAPTVYYPAAAAALAAEDDELTATTALGAPAADARWNGHAQPHY